MDYFVLTLSTNCLVFFASLLNRFIRTFFIGLSLLVKRDICFLFEIFTSANADDSNYKSIKLTKMTRRSALNVLYCIDSSYINVKETAFIPEDAVLDRKSVV